MNGKFIISHSLFNFSVCINAGKVTVETCLPCEYKKEFCDIFAKSHEMIIAGYLQRKNIKQDIESALLAYHAERKWVVRAEC